MICFLSYFTTVKQVLSRVLKKFFHLTLIRRTCPRIHPHCLLQCRALAVKLFSTHISSEKTAIFGVPTHHSNTALAQLKVHMISELDCAHPSHTGLTLS